MRTLLCCIGRLENQYIREFVEHYKSIGVTNICLYDNNRDGEERFEDAVGDYIGNGFVILKDYRNRTICQMDAYNECYREYGNSYDWLMFFDCDEFLFLNGGNRDICDYLSKPIFDNFQMIHVNWRVYGDNGLCYNNGEPVIKRFKEPLPDDICMYYFWPENNHVKSIIRGGLEGILFERNSHTIVWPRIACCNADGEEIDPFESATTHTFKNAELRHYAMKTAEEYAMKMLRGFPDYTVDDGAMYFLTKTRFFSANEFTEEKNEVFKRIMGMDFSKPRKRTDAKVYMLCHKIPDYGLIDDEIITPLECGASERDEHPCEVRDNTGDNISDKNYFFTEDTGLYWIWKNVHSKYKGQMQYRRRLEGINILTDFDEIFSEHDAIIAEPMDLADLYFMEGLTLEEQYGIAHNLNDLLLMEQIVKEMYPEYSEDYDKYIKHGSNILYSNGFILRQEDYDDYCEKLFSILFEWLRRMNIHNKEELHKFVYDCVMHGDISNATMPPSLRSDMNYILTYQSRIGGSLAERFFTLYAFHHFKNIYYVAYNKPEGNKL